MRIVTRLLLGGACLSVVPIAPAADFAYVVSYVEAMPAARNEAADQFRRLAMLSRKEAGSVRFEVLQRIGYPDQFVVLEVWDDMKAREAHAGTAHTQIFRDKLKPLLRAPYDERPHITLSVGPTQANAKGAVYAVTHVDVVPKAKDEGTEAVRALSTASRGTAGNVRFDSLTQTNRPNHMTLVEVWKDQKAVGAHSAAAHTKLFRDKLGPLTGALFDERFYHALD
jgi:quinol monooxygenase YgiN